MYPNTTQHCNAVIISLLLLIATGCSTDTENNSNGYLNHNGKNLSVDIPVPSILVGMAISNLEVSVQLDNDTPEPMDFNADTGGYSKTLSGISVGNHDLVVTYSVNEGGDDLTLARFSTNVEVTKDTPSEVNINKDNLDTNFDEDNDGFLNLAEAKAGTLLKDKLSNPGGRPLYTIANGSFEQSTSTSFQIKHTVGEPVNGQSSSASTNFSIVHGFKNY
jgi:hypothetical protein